MNQTHRLLLAIGIILVDCAVFVLPLASFFAAYILLSRPAWFKDWVSRIYESA